MCGTVHTFPPPLKYTPLPPRMAAALGVGAAVLAVSLTSLCPPLVPQLSNRQLCLWWCWRSLPPLPPPRSPSLVAVAHIFVVLLASPPLPLPSPPLSLSRAAGDGLCNVVLAVPPRHHPPLRWRHRGQLCRTFVRQCCWSPPTISLPSAGAAAGCCGRCLCRPAGRPPAPTASSIAESVAESCAGCVCRGADDPRRHHSSLHWSHYWPLRRVFVSSC